MQEELKNYMIVHKNENLETLWTIPNLELPMEVVINSTIRNAEKYLLVTQSLENFYFLDSYELDWNLPTGSISGIFVNIEKASNKFIELIRNVRLPILQKLDVDYIKSLEFGNQTLTSEIVSKKEQLRDITNIDLSDVTNLNELESKWPTELLGDYPFPK